MADLTWYVVGPMLGAFIVSGERPMDDRGAPTIRCNGSRRNFPPRRAA